MRRGEVWWVNFSPSGGSEIKKKRPAVIFSNNSANRFLNRVQVVPLTSNTIKLYPSEARVTIGKKQGKARQWPISLQQLASKDYPSKWENFPPRTCGK